MTHSTSAALPESWAPNDLKISCLRFVEEERGQDMIEYALIAATIGLGTVAGIHGIAASISQYMVTVGDGFNAALSGHA